MQSAINITGNNYEAFFLLYVDNELSAAERKAVEEFAQANPDLAVELELLLQVQLGDEALVFEEKETLYRKESADISLANYEEQFLLFVDNELAPDAKEKVERFVLQHPALQEGFTLLKQTRLETETVVFPDRKSLYRKEEKEKPVFYLRWQRIAVAAALIGLAVLVWTIVPQRKPGTENVANVAATQVPGSAQDNGGSDPSKNNSGTGTGNMAGGNGENVLANNSNPSARTQTNANGKPVIVNENNRGAEVSTNTNGSAATAAGEPPVQTNNNVLAYTEAPQTKAVESTKNETVSLDNRNGFQTAIAGTQRISEDHAALENNSSLASNTDAVAGGPSNNDVTHAVYKELNTEDENKSLLLGSLEINKDKLRGFFRKAGSIFRSKSKTEDEKTESRPTPNTRSLK